MEKTTNPFAAIENQLKTAPVKKAPAVIFKIVIAGQAFDVPISLN